MVSNNYMEISTKKQRTCIIEECTKPLLGRSNQQYCKNCANENKKEYDRNNKARKRSEQKVTVPEIEKYLKEEQNYFQKFDDDSLVDKVTFKFGLNKKNIKHMDMVRKAQSLANVEAGYNIKVGEGLGKK